MTTVIKSIVGLGGSSLIKGQEVLKIVKNKFILFAFDVRVLNC